MKKLIILLAVVLISITIIVGVDACNKRGNNTSAPATPAQIENLKSAVGDFEAKKDYSRVTTGVQEVKMELPQSTIDALLASGKTQVEIDAMQGSMKSTLSQTRHSKLSGTSVVRKEAVSITDELNGAVVDTSEEIAYWANGVAYYPVTVGDGATATQEIEAAYTSLREFDAWYSFGIFEPKVIDALDSATKKGNEYTVDLTDVMAAELEAMLGELVEDTEGLDYKVSMVLKITLSNDAVAKIVRDTSVEIVMPLDEDDDQGATTFSAVDLTRKVVLGSNIEIFENSTNGLSVSIPSNYQSAFVAEDENAKYLADLSTLFYSSYDYTSKLYVPDEHGDITQTIDMQGYSVLNEKGFMTGAYIKAVVTTLGETDVASQPIYMDYWTQASLMCVAADQEAAEIIRALANVNPAIRYVESIQHAADLTKTIAYNAETDAFDVVLSGTVDATGLVTTVTTSIGADVQVTVVVDGVLVLELTIVDDGVEFDNPIVNPEGFGGYVNINGTRRNFFGKQKN